MLPNQSINPTSLSITNIIIIIIFTNIISNDVEKFRFISKNEKKCISYISKYVTCSKDISGFKFHSGQRELVRVSILVKVSPN